MEANSHNMRDAAAGFEKNTGEVKRIMYWRNMKLTICIVVIVICVIALIVLLFIKK